MHPVPLHQIELPCNRSSSFALPPLPQPVVGKVVAGRAEAKEVMVKKEAKEEGEVRVRVFPCPYPGVRAQEGRP
jgi:hypothetical protein